MMTIIKSLISKYGQFLKFCLVGASGVFVNMAVYATALYTLRVDYLVASIVAFFFAAISNFTFNKFFTFQNRDNRVSQILWQFIRFVAASGIGLLINLLCLRLMVEYVKLHTLVAQLLAIGIATFSNFLFSKRWAFKEASSGQKTV